MRAISRVGVALACSALTWSTVATADPPPNPMAAPVRRIRPLAGDRPPVPTSFAAASAQAAADTPPVAPAAAPAPAAPPAVAPPIPAPVPVAQAPAVKRPPHRSRKPRPVVPAAPALPAAPLTLTLDTPSPDGPWALRYANTGSIPVRIVADSRLLTLDVTLPGAKETAHPIHCTLPGAMRPDDDDDDGRTLVLLPGRTYTDKIDPRLFCFGAHDAEALVAGANVVPHLVGTRALAVVQPIEEIEPVVATAHEWTGAASTIGPAPAPSAPKEPPRARPLALTAPPFVDVGRSPEIAIPVTVRNESASSVVFLFRPETLAFDVTGPSGVGVTDPSPTVHCSWPGPTPSPIRDLFTHMATHGSTSLSVLPSVLCPEGTFDRPGLYVVRARLDTRKVSGEPVGLHTFDGEVASETATRLRVRETTGKEPSVPPPHMDIAPAHDAPPAHDIAPAH